MKWLSVLALVVISQLTAAYELPTKTVALSVHGSGVRDVLESLLGESGVGYDIDPQISNDAKINVMARGAWAQIFKRVLDDAKLTYGFDTSGKILVIKN